MKVSRLLIRVYGEKTGDQWTLINLEFSLAAQAETLQEARTILESQIKEYLTDALAGQDRAHASVLLKRRAPAKYWIKYWIGMTRAFVFGHSNAREEAFTEPLPMVPA